MGTGGALLRVREDEAGVHRGERHAAGWFVVLLKTPQVHFLFESNDVRVTRYVEF